MSRYSKWCTHLYHDRKTGTWSNKFTAIAILYVRPLLSVRLSGVVKSCEHNIRRETLDWEEILGRYREG